MQEHTIKSELSETATHLSCVFKMIGTNIKHGFSKVIFHRKSDTNSFRKEIEKQYRDYIEKVKKLSKEEIINSAEEICYIQNFSAELKKSEVDGLGLISDMSNLFVHLYESVKHDKDRDSSPEYIRKALMDFISSKEKDKAYTEKIISNFQNEIKGLEIQDTTLIISLSETGIKDVTFTIPSREFYKYIEPDVLDRFGDKYLSDFPYPSFFGSKNCEIYKELLESRFSQNFIRYFKAFQLTGKNNGIIKLKKGKNYSETLVNELKNRQVLAEFIKRNYYHPEQVLDNMLKHNLESSKAIEDFNKTLGGAVK